MGDSEWWQSESDRDNNRPASKLFCQKGFGSWAGWLARRLDSLLFHILSVFLILWSVVHIILWYGYTAEGPITDSYVLVFNALTMRRSLEYEYTMIFIQVLAYLPAASNLSGFDLIWIFATANFIRANAYSQGFASAKRIFASDRSIELQRMHVDRVGFSVNAEYVLCSTSSRWALSLATCVPAVNRLPQTRKSMYSARPSSSTSLVVFLRRGLCDDVIFDGNPAVMAIVF